jgi:hypothetical protein
VCGGKGQLMSECPPVLVRSLLLLHRKEDPFSKLKEVLERTKIWSWVPTGPETKIDCAGENQHHFTRKVDYVINPLFSLNEISNPRVHHAVCVGVSVFLIILLIFAMICITVMPLEDLPKQQFLISYNQ